MHESDVEPEVVFKHVLGYGTAGVDFVGVYHPGYLRSPPGRETPAGRSVSGRGYFGPREDTVRVVQCSVRPSDKSTFFIIQSNFCCKIQVKLVKH